MTELGGGMDLSEITVKNVYSGELTTYKADEKDGMFGVFFIGTRPNTDLFAGTELSVDDKGYIPTDEEMQTNIPGVYAAGDVRVKSLRQVVTAAADGAIAAVNAGKYARSL